MAKWVKRKSRHLRFFAQMIVRLFPEEVRLLAMPVVQRVDRRPALQTGFRELIIFVADVSEERLFDPLAGAEAMAQKDVVVTVVEALDNAVRLRLHRRHKVVFDVELGAEAVELVGADGRAAAEAEKSVGESVARRRCLWEQWHSECRLGEQAVDLQVSGTLELAPQTASVGRLLCRVNSDEDPAGRTVDADEQISAPLLIGYLRWAFYVDMQVAATVNREAFVSGLRRFWLQVLRPEDATAAKTAAEARAQHVGVQELPDHGDQIVARQNRRQFDRLLCLRPRCRQPVRGIATVVNAVLFAPPPHHQLGDAVVLRRHPCRLCARLHRRPGLRLGRRIRSGRSDRWRELPPFVRREQRVRPPFSNLAKDRLCHEHDRAALVQVIFRDEAIRDASHIGLRGAKAVSWRSHDYATAIALICKRAACL